MKGKMILVVFLLTSVCQLFSQEYDINKLKVVAKVWGETYLFHPAIVQDSQKIDWEKQLVDFLPNLKKTNLSEEFIALLNDSLLSCLGDDFTFVSSGKDGNHAKAVFNITDNKKFDYLRIDSDDFGNIENLNKIDSVINDRDSNKPLVVDVRLTDELGIDYHTYNFFEYFVSMLINEPVMLSPMVSREHFGWDEYNDWWFYEQRWKVANKDVDIISNGKLLPYADYIPILNQYNPDFNSENFKTITRPIVFITNKTFDSYYGELLSDIRLNRKNTFIIGEDTGEVIIAPNSNLKKYGFKDFDFVLNPALSVSNNRSGLIYDLKCNDITN